MEITSFSPQLVLKCFCSSPQFHKLYWIIWQYSFSHWHEFNCPVTRTYMIIEAFVLLTAGGENIRHVIIWIYHVIPQFCAGMVHRLDEQFKLVRRMIFQINALYFKLIFPMKYYFNKVAKIKFIRIKSQYYSRCLLGSYAYSNRKSRCLADDTCQEEWRILGFFKDFKFI